MNCTLRFADPRLVLKKGGREQPKGDLQKEFALKLLAYMELYTRPPISIPPPDRITATRLNFSNLKKYRIGNLYKIKLKP